MSQRTTIDIRLRHSCPTCNEMGRPLKRVWGFPNNPEEAARLEARGQIRHMGCCIFDGQSDYECRHCEADWDFGRFSGPLGLILLKSRP
jgi:hypothetical protein